MEIDRFAVKSGVMRVRMRVVMGWDGLDLHMPSPHVCEDGW